MKILILRLFTLHTCFSTRVVPHITTTGVGLLQFVPEMTEMYRVVRKTNLCLLSLQRYTATTYYPYNMATSVATWMTSLSQHVLHSWTGQLKMYAHWKCRLDETTELLIKRLGSLLKEPLSQPPD